MTRRPCPRRLSIERLEDRDLPSTVWGVPWPDGQHLTLSLAPDGTSISGESSALSSVLAQAGSNGEYALLEAFQTWADNANINFGLVSDGGQAFGVGKAIQDDPRFGDIRVGAVPIGSDVLAVTSPFDYFNTYSGDVVINSAQPIGTTYSLYAVALHEAGHALGLPDNDDPNSVMYEYYTGANTTLDANDIAAIQSLYGARPANNANNTLATAASYISSVYGQLNSPTDAAFYKFSTPLLFTGTTIHLQAEGLSMLDATVSVFNSSGKLVASATATNPSSNDLTLDLNNLSMLSKYYVEVSSPNGGAFDVGTYNLTITNNLDAVLGDVVGDVLGLLNGVGHTLATATDLVANTLGLGGQVNYNASSTLNTSLQTDYYAVKAPPSTGLTSETLVATVWTLGNQSLTPQLSVFDSQGNPVAFQVLTETSGGATVEVENAVPGQIYKLEVHSGARQTGSYSLSVSFLSSPILFPMSTSSTLNSSTPAAAAALDVDQTQVIHFVLSAGAVPIDPNTLVTMTITDSEGDVVATLQTTAGDAASLDVCLGIDTYTVTVAESTSDGSALQPIDVNVSAIGETDPVSIAMANPTSKPAGTTSPSGSSGTSSSTSSSGASSTTVTMSGMTPVGKSTLN
jgi:hypothetical protein